MASISDIGNGYGLIYQVENTTLKILTVSKNDKDGERSMKNIAVIDAPLSTNRASTGYIQITGVASVGTINNVMVNGIDILGSPYNITTNNTVTESIGLAGAINAYTPVSGYKYFAYNVGAIVYLQSPIDVGAIANGYIITASVSTGSIVLVKTPFAGGTTTTTVYDSLVGRRYYLNADYNASGVTNTLAAPINSLTNAIEVTKYIVARGMQVGIPKIETTINNEAIDAERLSSSQMVFLKSADDIATLVFITTAGFVDGDILYLRSKEAIVSVESAPVTTSTSPFKNIYLASDQPFEIGSETKVLMLQYGYNDSVGASVFMEVARSSASDVVNIGVGEGIYKGLNGTVQEFKTISSTANFLTFSTVSDTVVLSLNASIGGWAGSASIIFGAGVSDSIYGGIEYRQIFEYIWNVAYPAKSAFIIRGSLNCPSGLSTTSFMLFKIPSLTSTRTRKFPVLSTVSGKWGVMNVYQNGGYLEFWLDTDVISLDPTIIYIPDMIITIGD